MHLNLLRHSALTFLRWRNKKEQNQPIGCKDVSLRTAVHQYNDVELKENILSSGGTSEFGSLLADLL